MRGLAKGAGRGRQVNVLQHAAGYFKDAPAADRAELAEAIDEYRRGVAPLEAPLTLLRHHVRRSGEPWLRAQTWFDPCPRALLA